MKLIASRAVNTWTTGVFCLLLCTGCANMSTGVGISFPIGGLGSIGVSVGSDGRLGANVGVGVGAATVSVGTSGQLPTASPAPAPVAQPTTAPTAPAASATVAQ